MPRFKSLFKMSEPNTKLLYILHITHTNCEGTVYPEHPWNSTQNFVSSSYDKEEAIAEAIKCGEFIATHANQQLEDEDAEFIRTYKPEEEEPQSSDSDSEPEEDWEESLKKIKAGTFKEKPFKSKTFNEICDNVEKKSLSRNHQRITRGEKQTQYVLKEFPRFHPEERDNGTVAHYIVHQPFDRSPDRDPKISRFDPDEKLGDYDPSIDHFHIYVQSVPVKVDTPSVKVDTQIAKLESSSAH
jgi:hypothetical protein